MDKRVQLIHLVQLFDFLPRLDTVTHEVTHTHCVNTVKYSGSGKFTEVVTGRVGKDVAIGRHPAETFSAARHCGAPAPRGSTGPALLSHSSCAVVRLAATALLLVLH